MENEAVLKALPTANLVHFSCHGLANLEVPLQSALIMANNEPLTVVNWQRSTTDQGTYRIGV